MWTWESIRPGMAIMPPASMATSQSEVLPPVPTETILPSSRMIVSPAATGAAISPERIFAIFQIATFMASASLAGFARGDFFVGEAADAGIEPAAVRQTKDHGDFVGHRRIGQHQRHAVVMGADVDVVLVVHRNIDRRARAGFLGDRKNPRFAAAEQVADGIGERRGQKRVGVFLLAVEADDTALAVALHVVAAPRR